MGRAAGSELLQKTGHSEARPMLVLASRVGKPLPFWGVLEVFKGCGSGFRV